MRRGPYNFLWGIHNLRKGPHNFLSGIVNLRKDTYSSRLGLLYLLLAFPLRLEQTSENLLAVNDGTLFRRWLRSAPPSSTPNRSISNMFASMMPFTPSC